MGVGQEQQDVLGDIHGCAFRLELACRLAPSVLGIRYMFHKANHSQKMRCDDTEHRISARDRGLVCFLKTCLPHLIRACV